MQEGHGGERGEEENEDHANGEVVRMTISVKEPKKMMVLEVLMSLTTVLTLAQWLATSKLLT